MDSIYNAIAQGILWGIMGIGLYITFRILRFPDLTTESSFTGGAAVAVTLMVQGVDPFLSTLIAVVVGMLMGLVTGIFMTYFEIPAILSGIITLTGLYSINLRIMDTSNISLRRVDTVYDIVGKYIDNDIGQRFVIGIAFALIVILLLHFFFKTDMGQAMIATGDNEIMADSLGISTPRMKRLAVMFANGLIALSGALVAQDLGFADINLGVGQVVTAFASIVIGEVIIRQTTIGVRFVTIILGAILYRLLLVFVLKLGFDPNDFRLVSALVLAIFLASPAIKRKINHRRPSTD